MKLFQTDHAQLAESGGQIAELCAFLDADCPPNIADVLAKPHSLQNRPGNLRYFDAH
ncbi:hypothetical protein [Pseudorhodoplanes sinuspersici]|uniref:hypothetical protein n=1 Tax=Pseudorhodoplanes sinuspersici TaxID=1235591 RepID=UPI0012FDB193|nr:hypothetical protein [Pseudorhodoplanes sinuspersici]